MSTQERALPSDDNASFEEVGTEEVDAFEKKIFELVSHPKQNEMDSDAWEVDYEIGKTQVWICIPRPGSDWYGAETITVLVSQPSLEKEYSDRFRQMSLYEMHLGSRTMSYSEEIIEYDDKDYRVPHLQRQIEVEATMRGDFGPLLERVRFEESLRERIVTKERMNKLMALLDFLGPENEVI